VFSKGVSLPLEKLFVADNAPTGRYQRDANNPTSVGRNVRRQAVFLMF